MAKTSEARRTSAWAGGLALAGACVAMTACFRDEGPGQLCPAGACGSSSGEATSTTSTSTGEATPTSSGGASETTGAPVDTMVTLRLDTMVFIDPHLFFVEGGSDTGTGGDLGTCINDITDLVNTVLEEDINEGKFNLLVRFETGGVAKEVRVIDGECEPPETPGGPRVCRPNDETLGVLLAVEPVDAAPCRDLDVSVFQPVNVPLINDPALPCVRTRPAKFSLPVSDSVGSLNLRDAQIVASLDDALAPTRLMSGVLSGFLPMASAEDLILDAPLLGMVDLWSVIDVPACLSNHPDLLPSVDSFEINNEAVPGVWVAINFTAERVEYRP